MLSEVSYFSSPMFSSSPSKQRSAQARIGSVQWTPSEGGEEEEGEEEEVEEVVVDVGLVAQLQQYCGLVAMLDAAMTGSEAAS